MNSPNENPEQTPPETAAPITPTPPAQDPFPELSKAIDQLKASYLSYFDLHIEIVESYIERQPSVSIDACKAIVESMAKLIRQQLNGDSPGKLEDESFRDLVKGAMEALQGKSKGGKGTKFFVDISALLENIETLLNDIAKVRNKHGEIGHGRSPLKEEHDVHDYAKLIAQLTDCLSAFMLRRLFWVMKGGIGYDRHPEFNQFLDAKNPQPLYSRHLYEQRFKDYQDQLKKYLGEDKPGEAERPE